MHKIQVRHTQSTAHNDIAYNNDISEIISVNTNTNSKPRLKGVAILFETIFSSEALNCLLLSYVI